MPPLNRLNSRFAIAQLLGTSEKQIRYLLYVRSVRRRYSTFKIPKRRGGYRTIKAPKKDLKYLQQRLAVILSTIYSPRNAVHGFVKDRSIVTNAERHSRKRYVFNVDLENFFPTINFGRVRGVLMAPPYNIPEKGATILAQLCCHEGVLPQGAPTSPILSNMICARLDRQLTALAKQHNCIYTRYVDDITFSKQHHVFPKEIGIFDENKNAIVGKELRQIIESNGFRINSDKVWLYKNTHRQSVTGLTVNTKSNVSRNFIRQVRAMIHAWEKYGADLAQTEYIARYCHRQTRQESIPSFEHVIRGKLEFIKMVRGIGDPVYRNLQSKFVRVCPEYQSVMVSENLQMNYRDVFISHASEDKESVARPLTEELVRSGFSVWFDEYEILIGDSLRQKIDEGLANSKYGIVILSKNFISRTKTWPARELDGLTAKEDADVRKFILPIWHKIEKREVTNYSPSLAGLKALETTDKTPEQMVKELSAKLRS